MTNFSFPAGYDVSVFEERNFSERAELLDQLDSLRGLDGGPDGAPDGGSDGGSDVVPMGETSMDGLGPVLDASLKARLEAVDAALFERLRAEIFSGAHRGEAFRELLSAYCGVMSTDGPEYDLLDLFVNQLCSFLPLPEPTIPLEAEMVFYQKTPARIVLELARRISWSADDVFIDIGAGLGQAALLVHLLTGVAVQGIEIEPVFCVYARECAAGLGLPDVSFLCMDARASDYSRGTVFFLYTPFTGKLLDTVLERLRLVSLTRKITVVAYGPCTEQVARQGWLTAVNENSRVTAVLYIWKS